VFTETRIQSTIAAITGILNVVVLLGWWDLTNEQIAGITTALLLAMGAIRVWFEPKIDVVGVGKDV
jgi:hypothetical protein